MNRSPTVAEAARVIREATALCEAPHVQNAVSRFVGYACLPLCCAPCVAWSALWRLVACPFQCMCNGSAFLCSDNGCTACSDSCISAYASSLGQRRTIPHIDDLDLAGASPEDRDELAAALHNLIGCLSSTTACAASDDLTANVAAPLVGPKNAATSVQAVAHLRLARDRVLSAAGVEV